MLEPGPVGTMLQVNSRFLVELVVSTGSACLGMCAMFVWTREEFLLKSYVGFVERSKDQAYYFSPPLPTPTRTLIPRCSCSVQFEMVSVRSEKPICAPPRLSKFPQRRL